MAGRGRQRVVPNEPPFKAYVGNLPFDSLPSDLDFLFKEFSIVQIKMVRDYESNDFKGFAYVEFKTREDLEKAIDLDGVRFENRALRVDVADIPRGRESRGGRGGFGGRGGNSRGVPPPFRGREVRYGGSRSSDRRGNRYDFGSEDDNFDHVGIKEGNAEDFESAASSSAANLEGGERRRLQLKPRTTDPVELERLRKCEEEATKKRMDRIFNAK